MRPKSAPKCGAERHADETSHFCAAYQMRPATSVPPICALRPRAPFQTAPALLLQVVECYRTSVLGDPPLASLSALWGEQCEMLHRRAAFTYVSPAQVSVE